MAEKAYYASPSFLFRERTHDRSAEEDASRALLTELLSTRKGSVLSAPGYGLPPLSDFASETANESMVQAIGLAIRTYLPQLEAHLGRLFVKADVENNETVFLVCFLREGEDEEVEVATRYIDARWVVVNKM